MQTVTKTCGKRLLTAANFVGRGAVFADIGTDHGYLPIHLVIERIVTRAYACDVAREPLASAAENIALAGLGERIETRLTSGFAGLDGLGLTDAAVCGMGGELIVSLLADENAAFLRRDRVRLILQPMSRAATLRAWLAENGFLILDETLCEDMGRQYELMLAVYGGTPYRLAPLDLQLGPVNRKHGNAALKRLCDRRIDHLRKRIGGEMGDARAATERLIAELEQTKQNIGETP